MMQTRFYILFLIILTGLQSCKSGAGLFKASSPYELYRQKLIAAGLDKTDLGTNWINSSELSNRKALTINIPFKENGYFPADRTPANSYRFKVSRGQKITVAVTQKPAGRSLIYIDVWELTSGGNKRLASADTLGNAIQIDVDEDGEYLMRLQPQLLQAVSYILEITSGPSLGFPTGTGRNNIKSFWGDGRDGNTRRHEGVDIFGTRRSPVIAASNGRIMRVNENNLGGKVVWLRPVGKDFTLYYAHLDEQIALEGQQVNEGDTLGLMGNTGNARMTAPHLHFGIYANSGAIDPLPFIDPAIKQPPAIKAHVGNLNKIMRTGSNISLKGKTQDQVARVLPKGTIVQVSAVHDEVYRVELPDGDTGLIASNALEAVSKPVKKIKIMKGTVLYDRAAINAAVKRSLDQDKYVSLLGSFGNYLLVSDEAGVAGWISM